MDITQEFIRQIFINTNIDEKYMLILLKNIDEFQIAFQSREFDNRYNYELYEYLGDMEANNAIVWYFYTVFPQLRCAQEIKTLTRLKNLYVSTDSFSDIAYKLGFEPFIKATNEELIHPEKRLKLLEDVFEAFIGVTKVVLEKHFGVVGLANQIIYNLIKSIFDQRDISLNNEDLFDAKTRLKELFDQQLLLKQQFGFPVYKYDQTTLQSTLHFQKGSHVVFIGSGKTKPQKEKDTSKQAIEYLKSVGFEVEKKFNLHCEKSKRII